MNLRKSSAPLLCAALAFAATPLLSFAADTTTPAPADASAAPAPAPVITAPASTAAPTATPAEPPTTAPVDTTVAPSERPATYTIVQGDSLWKIAHTYGTTVVELRKVNDLKKGALLHPGQVLKLPPATPAK